MNQFKTILLMLILSMFLLVIGSYFGGEAGLKIAFIISLAMNFVSYFFSDKIVLTMYGAQRVERQHNPALYDTVERLATYAGLPMPKLYIINTPTPNAFATGRNPNNAAVAVTTGIMRILSKEELEGVIAHELAHIKNRDILVQTISATLVSTITYLVHFFAFFGGSNDERRERNIFVDLALMILAPIAATLIQLAISRSREYLADETGAQICGNPMYLANALKKLAAGNEAIPMDAEPATAHMFIVSPLSGSGFVKLFSTHPPLEDRIQRLIDMANGRR